MHKLGRQATTERKKKSNDFLGMGARRHMKVILLFIGCKLVAFGEAVKFFIGLTKVPRVFIAKFMKANVTVWRDLFDGIH